MRGNQLTLAERLAELGNGKTSATSLLDDALATAAEPNAEAVYTQVFKQTAQAEAKAVDIQRDAGVPTGALAGLPVAVKDLFDVKGQVTRSGSRLLSDRPPATEDAEVVRRLRQAGAVIVGHTNMTEFAYSGLGLNPHYGTPPNPLDEARIPGGSSSGSAVAVARGMAAAGLATDTGGSVRIPAAFCGLAGFKPTQSRIPGAGMFPLSTTLDSIGAIAPSVDCCARMDAVLSGHPPTPLQPAQVRGLRLMVPDRYVLEDMDTMVADAFDRALQTLSGAGATVRTSAFEVLTTLPELGQGGGFTAAESYRIHRQWLATHREAYDPRVAVRIERGKAMTAAEYLDLLDRRTELMAIADRTMADWDALVMPTVPVVPPLLSALENDEAYTRINQLVLRNPTVANLLGLCAITLPCHRPGELPVGLTLVGRAGQDHALLRYAVGVESLLDATE